MITLSNGDRWIIDDSEWEDQDIEYEEACKGNIPETDVRDFVEKLCKSRSCDDNTHEYFEPRKLTTEHFSDGYWDCNFDPFSEVFGSIAGTIISNPWSTVYVMPWNEVIVVFQRADSGGYDVETVVKVYDCFDTYFKQVVKVMG